MSITTSFALAFSLSADAFAASLGKGAALHKPRLSEAARIAAYFGAFELISPLVGLALGYTIGGYIEAVDHWIAFALLGGVGLHMMLSRSTAEATAPASSWRLIATAVGTSIDAMAVGVSLAFLNVNILVIAAAIGVATMTMSSIGMMTGRVLGRRFGKGIEVIGGIALIGLGATILYEHLSAG